MLRRLEARRERGRALPFLDDAQHIGPNRCLRVNGLALPRARELDTTSLGADERLYGAERSEELLARTGDEVTSART